VKFAVIAPVAAGVTADPEWMSAVVRHVVSRGFESIVVVETRDALSACTERLQLSS
jgi:hypothetical protein